MTKAEKRRHELDRIIVGNQIAIMRALALTTSHPARTDIDLRVRAIKDWWREQYGEEVGFSTAWGDQPPR